MEPIKIIAVTQARYGSTRLPGKVLKRVNNKTLLQLHLERIKRSEYIDEIVVATTLEDEAAQIAQIAIDLGHKVYRGSTNDVLDRYYQSIKDENADYIVRVTSDCPLIDPELIDAIIKNALEKDYDYYSNIVEPSFPNGADVEIMKFSALKKAWEEAKLPFEREHVTPYIWQNSSLFNKDTFTAGQYKSEVNYSDVRLTVDYVEDYEVIKHLVENLGEQKSWLDYINYLMEHTDIRSINSSIDKNEAANSSQVGKIKLRTINNFTKSDAYREKVHSLIPGGAHTYSKGDDQFPGKAPAAIAYGKGVQVWDIDGNQFLDCAMGLSSVSLGHAYEAVIDKVKKELDNGVNFQRPSYLELEMAEKFLSLIPQHDMVKFAKNGSAVTTAAVKLARAYTGRKYVAFPGDHPFYSYDDWFIGTTACNLGVPEEISNLSLKFNGQDIQSLKNLFEQYPGQIACVITEPERCVAGHFGEPANKYLKEAIALTQQNGALFILDEMITGYKTGFPGTIQKFDLKPDMATWGKGIANGFSFCALTGTKEVMQLGGINKPGAEKMFLISTTHGGETHAMAAALATLEVFQLNNVVAHNHNIGKLLSEQVQKLITEHSLLDYIEIVATDWMIGFSFLNSRRESCQGMRTLVMQEMISRGVLFQGSFIPCYSHSTSDVDYFIEALDQTLAVYKNALEDGYEKFLVGMPAKPVFRKYI